MHKTAVAGVLLAALYASAAWAEPAPSAQKLELAHRYILAIHMDRTFKASMDAMLPMMMEQSPAGTNLTADQKQVVIEVTREVAADMMDKMIRRLEPIMADTFTEDELQGLVTFYEGPVGQSLIAKSPQMAAKIQPVLKDLMPETKAEMILKLCARLDCKGTQKGLAPKAS